MYTGVNEGNRVAICARKNFRICQRLIGAHVTFMPCRTKRAKTTFFASVTAKNASGVSEAFLYPKE